MPADTSVSPQSKADAASDIEWRRQAQICWCSQVSPAATIYGINSQWHHFRFKYCVPCPFSIVKFTKKADYFVNVFWKFRKENDQKISLINRQWMLKTYSIIFYLPLKHSPWGKCSEARGTHPEKCDSHITKHTDELRTYLLLHKPCFFQSKCFSTPYSQFFSFFFLLDRVVVPVELDSSTECPRHLPMLLILSQVTVRHSLGRLSVKTEHRRMQPWTDLIFKCPSGQEQRNNCYTREVYHYNIGPVMLFHFFLSS